MDFLIDVNENFMDHTCTFCFASVILHSLIEKSQSDLAPAYIKVKPSSKNNPESQVIKRFRYQSIQTLLNHILRITYHVFTRTLAFMIDRFDVGPRQCMPEVSQSQESRIIKSINYWYSHYSVFPHRRAHVKLTDCMIILSHLKNH